MERRETFHFSDEELDTLESALAMYAAYTRDMEVDMLVGDESDASDVYSNHYRAASMHKEIFNLVYDDHSYEKEREMFHDIHGRPMDLNDFSDFDWYEYLHGDDE